VGGRLTHEPRIAADEGCQAHDRVGAVGRREGGTVLARRPQHLLDAAHPGEQPFGEGTVEVRAPTVGLSKVPGVHEHVCGVEAVDRVGQRERPDLRVGEVVVAAVEQSLDRVGALPPRRGGIVADLHRLQGHPACGEESREPVDEMRHHVAHRPPVDRRRR